MTLPYHPLCVKCEEDGTETLATTERWGEPYCEDCDTSANEAAYERSLSDYYGGSGAVSLKEQMDAAYTLDGRLR